MAHRPSPPPGGRHPAGAREFGETREFEETRNFEEEAAPRSHEGRGLGAAVRLPAAVGRRSAGL
ncbi:hypothetical protein MTQ01_17070 [Streptomyces sp. XM4193]|uniref:hypothetical protein n=1 Tax=Streptomyces sp. XM4193 TaxID=2929782 RepID=UPI001FF9193B|nr:hypothetical protein [Streptomyces sp. XM4193]MCK1797707.1 hypothetical protein [Streptomyces sp. XM4193]